MVRRDRALGGAVVSENAWSVLCAIVEQHALHHHIFPADAFQQGTVTELRDRGLIETFPGRGRLWVHFTPKGLHEYTVIS